MVDNDCYNWLIEFSLGDLPSVHAVNEVEATFNEDFVYVLNCQLIIY